ASVITLPLIYVLGRELFDHRRALLAMLIFALSPMQIYFAQEARTYALLGVPITVALFGIARFLGGDRRALWLYALGGIIGMYCHATMAMFLAACNVAVLAAILRSNRATLAQWIITNAIVGLAALPELVIMVLSGGSGSGLQWIPEFQLRDF